MRWQAIAVVGVAACGFRGPAAVSSDGDTAIDASGIDAAIADPDATVGVDASRDGAAAQRYLLPLVPTDLVAAVGSHLDLLAGAIIDTDAQTISGTGASSTFDHRAVDTGACPIAFFIADTITVSGTIHARGSRSVALIAGHTVTLVAGSTIDVRGVADVPGVGGAVGGIGSVAGGGAGGGGLGTYSGSCCDSGAGGAGFAAAGGGGGGSGPAPGGPSGPAVAIALDRLCGGSGGGGAAGPVMAGCNPRGAHGGGGGGGVMLGAYASIDVEGVINAGGAGGRGAACGGGGGGGAGGEIVVAAPLVTIGGVVAANGGGGGGAGVPASNNPPGQDGQPSSTAAAGGVSNSGGTAGGLGGAAATLGGTAALADPENGGGGGGATGRIFLATKPGAPATITGVVSPAIGTTAIAQSNLALAP